MAKQVSKKRSKQGVAVVAGVGAPKGLGAALARRFASEGLHVFIAGRTLERLEAIAGAISAAGGFATPVVADVTREADVRRLFDLADKKKSLELAVYNVGNNIALPLLETSPETFESLWKQNAFGGFLFGSEAVRRLASRGKGTLIFTGATASLRARPPFVGFASAKAALRAVAQGLAREFGPKGVHVAHVIVDGVIDGDYARGKFAAYVESKGEGGLLEPDAIADAYWTLHRQHDSTWTHELDLRPFKEPF
ncbi:MAG: SDR family NAD(P)-dependent oxidoreductase [Rhodomicrobium sp.]